MEFVGTVRPGVVGADLLEGVIADFSAECFIGENCCYYGRKGLQVGQGVEKGVVVVREFVMEVSACIG